MQSHYEVIVDELYSEPYIFDRLDDAMSMYRESSELGLYVAVRKVVYEYIKVSFEK